MAVAINKSIEIPRMGGLTAVYWKLMHFNADLGSNRVKVRMVPFLSQAEDGVKSPASLFGRNYTMTFAQAQLGTSQTGNQLRDTILNWLLNNEPDFTGGTLV